jgi:hypothetical protein
MDSATLDAPAPSTTAAAPASSGADSGLSSGTGGSTGAVVDSSSDLLSDLPGDLFSGIDTEGAGAGTDTTDDDDPVDEGAGTDDLEAPGGDEDQVEDDDQVEDEPGEGADTEGADKEAKPGEQAEELPEGVTRGKNSSGKPGLFVEDSRWKNIYGNHQLVQKTSELLGEPVTMEALQLRNDAYMAQEQLFHDLTSGDPKAQGALLNYFFDEMARAKEEGEVGVDASVPMAQTFYTTLRERSPDGYANLRFAAARDLLTEMFTEAAEKSDDNLRLSAQHFARVLAGVDGTITDARQVAQIARSRGVPFYTKDEMPQLRGRGAADPVEALRQENARLRAERDGSATTNQAAQRGQWIQETDRAVADTIQNDAVKPALAAVEKEWSKFPKQFQQLVADPLHRQVVDAIKQDKVFEGKIRLLKEQALRATSAQKRTEFGQAIKTAYLNRAKLAVDAVKGAIYRDAAEFFQERVNQRRDRREAAQNRTAPSGTNGTVPRTVLPKDLVDFKDGVFDSDTAVRQARQLLGA